MLFCSTEFIFIFFPVVLFLYYNLPAKLRNLLLLLASLVFYINGEQKYVYVLLISLVVNYLAALVIEKVKNKKGKRFFLFNTLLFDFSTLFIFKYADFAIENVNRMLQKGGVDTILEPIELVLPLGISFYTFQLASYVIDVYWDRTPAEHNVIDFAAYLCMFPQLIAGPIVKYVDIAPELKTRKFHAANLEEGLKLFTIGLASKMLLANPMGNVWNRVQVLGFESISTPLAWVGAIAFSFQIYYDFNGYSLMAVGLCRMLGFYISPNFDAPYTSQSFSEFWRRWHISLGTWFREYIYIPLGGNRVGKVKLMRNLFVVWLLTGVWHGAEWNFVLWGFFLFVVLLLEKTVLLKHLEAHPILSRVYMVMLIPVSWMLFAITDINELVVYLGRLIGLGTVTLSGAMLNTELWSVLKNSGFTMLLCVFFILPFAKKWYDKNKNKFRGFVVLLILFWASVYQIVYSATNPFLYFRF